MMRRSLPCLVALMLGAGAAGLAACADSKTKGGIPAGDASDIKRQLEDIRGTVDSAKCDRLSRELRQVVTRIDALPSSVDAQLHQRLDDGYDDLKAKALSECNENRDDQQTQTSTTDTQTEPPPTQTQPQTQTQTPTQTEPPVTTPPPPVEPPPVEPPPADPGGGTPPELTP